VLRAVLERRALRAASPRAERVVRRNVTFSPRSGTRVIGAPLPARERERVVA
jgi:hypothetical protein